MSDHRRTLTKDLVQQARELWVSKREKLFPEDIIYTISLADLFKFRKMRRTRDNAKSGSVSLDYVSMGKRKNRFKRKHPDLYVDGQTKWEQLRESLDEHGWLESHAALVMVTNRRPTPKIRDGHHRLGVAMELGMTHCPVKFFYVWKETDES